MTFNTYISGLLKNTKFNFLHGSIKNYNDIIGLLQKDSFLQQNEDLYKENFIRKEDNTIRYLTEDQWNKIYLQMLNLQYEKDISFNEDIKKAIKYCILDIYTYLLSICENFVISENQIDQFVHYCLQMSIVEELHKTKDLVDIKISHTNFAKINGFNLFKCIISTVQNLYLILENEGNEFMSEKDINKINQLLSSILQEDNVQACFIYKDLFGLDITPKHFLYNTLNTYIVYTYFSLYRDKELPFYIEYDIIKNYYNIEFYYKLEEKLNIFYIKFGNDLINIFIKYKILTLSKEITVKKQKYIVIFDNKTINYFSSHLEIYKTPLCRFNLDFIKNTANMSIYNTFYKSNKYIHTHKDMHLVLNASCYLRKEKPFTKFCIDIDYLERFLQYLEIVFKEPLSIDILVTHSEFFSLFGIESSLLLKSYQKATDNEKQNIMDIIQYSLNFNYLDFKSIAEKIDPVKSFLLINMFNKIVSYKYFIIGLLKEAICYSPFGNFINTTFIDSRGRSYYKGYYLNIQNYPIVKSFVKLYDPITETTLENNYAFIQDVIEGCLQNDHYKSKIKNISIEKYYTILQENQINYLYNLLNKHKITFVDLQKFLSTNITFNSALNFLKDCVKQKKRLFYCVSYILTLKYPKDNIINYYELDANASGLQMISILLKNTDTARISNLFGSANNDLYLIAANEFKKHIGKLNSMLDQFNKVFGMTYEKAYPKIVISNKVYSSLSNTQNKFNAFINANVKESYVLDQIILDLYDSLNDLFNKNISKEHIEDLASNLKWILPKELKYILTFVKLRYVNASFIKYLFLIKASIDFGFCLDKFPWISQNNLLFKRDLHKIGIMTASYNSTSFGRIEDFYHYLKDFSLSMMLFDNNNQYYLKQIACYIEYFFLHFKDIYLKGFQELNKIASIIAKYKKPIDIENKYFNITFMPCKQRDIRVYLTRSSKKVSLIMKQKTTIIDNTAIKRKFPANYIHSMDAYIVHNFYELLFLINNKLASQGLYVNYYTNHDTFMISLIPFLRIMLEECYTNLINNNYLDTLKNNPGIYEEICAYFNTTKNNDFNTNNLSEFFLK